MYDNGLVLGRFQGLHKGHQALIDTALANCRKVLVFVGSSDKSGSVRNPFTYSFREQMIRELYGDRIVVNPLPDIGVGDVGAWGDYLLSKGREAIGEDIRSIVCGNERKYHLWFPDNPNLSLIKLDRSEIPVSASELRSYIINDDYKSFAGLTDERMHKYYGIMRDCLLRIM
ncbi:MAG: adenylyltransferase/cytidyltransferase family protein [Lachnospiraceae bacterium]|nr:adenylyltransferase/cytidyltransferase family protein [Lachnospiraceae bacterium]